MVTASNDRGDREDETREGERTLARLMNRKAPGWLRMTTAAFAIASLASIIGVVPSSPAEASAGDDASAPAPESPAVIAARRGEVVPPDIADVEYMCALLTSCDRLPIPGSLIPHDFVSCVRSMSEDLSSPHALESSLVLRECGLRSNSCNELRTCALRGARADVCNGRGRSAVADLCDTDGRAVSCFHDQVVSVRDCPRGGEQCAVQNGHASCTLGACAADSPAQCSPSGTHVLECKGKKLLSLDCATVGLRCVSDANGAACAPATRACADSDKRCDGNAAVGCLHGHEVKVSCDAASLGCGGSRALGACSVPNGAAQCDPSEAPRCDGASVRYCDHGRPRSFLCKSVGLGRCTSDARGVRCG